MKSRTLDNPEKKGGGAAARKIFSPQELADLYMTNRPEFLILDDLQYYTLNWDQNFIFNVLYYIKEESQMDLIIAWFISKWGESHDVWKSRDRACDLSLFEEKIKFEKEVKYTKSLVLQKIEAEKSKEELRNLMMAGFRAPTQTQPVVQNIVDKTDNPLFVEPTALSIPEYHLADLPDNLKLILCINDDNVYSQYIDILKNEIRPWIQKKNNNKGNIKIWNVVKFISVFRGIINNSHNSTRQFVDFLNYIFELTDEEDKIKENTVTQFKDANDKNNYEKYDSLPNYKPLKSEGICVEKMLKPVIDAMNPKQNSTDSI